MRAFEISEISEMAIYSAEMAITLERHSTSLAEMKLIAYVCFEWRQALVISCCLFASLITYNALCREHIGRRYKRYCEMKRAALPLQARGSGGQPKSSLIVLYIAALGIGRSTGVDIPIPCVC